ncbi:hypothetical protein COT75_00650 [Candidatus Beckwithbacteria bacterium CG10_big_fil_rev_8_21_14_0_10_34_10]|uniref:Type II secretion system protein GspF domain-containing protein n=1 Tax=Candidatus Beckwithbacteria bacterium CG10_big_fil_rev_8_21_14_0_10_34_10 TaxID=1974495 RepID=A0A2H0WAK1_9BACT|nr:MAG: hypothetical protein COT75_00650 [Candidatus Beckwithbacteria bacterium CG10_big_fil_rev_8_21_14_0_10_34_10]
MDKYSYKAKSLTGKEITGLVEARSSKEALKLLHEKKLIVFNLHSKNQKFALAYLSVFQKVSQKDVAAMTRQLATMINAGLTLTASLSNIRDQSKPAVVTILNEIIKQVEGGSSFYEALAEHPKTFTQIYLSLIKSGEAAGNLDKVLAQMADSLEKNQMFTRKIKGAMIYPAIIMIGMIVVVFIMMIFVIPQLTSMYEEFSADLPFTTKILISTSEFTAKFWYIILVAVFGGLIAFKRWRKTKFGREKTDTLILKLPVAGKLVKKISLTQITRTLAMLISAGVPIIEALGIVSQAANNSIFENSIKQSAKDVEKGVPLTTALEKFEEYPSFVIQMVSVGEQTGKLGEVLARVANQFDQEAEETIKGLTSALEPLMMVILGIGVAFIVISIITPIYKLTSQF